MKTIVVWVLVFYFPTYAGSAPAVIDNISSRENCVALARIVTDFSREPSATGTRCVAVRKAVP